MSSTNRRISTKMNATAEVFSAAADARRLIDGEKRRSGLLADEARERVASRLGVAPGTLENLLLGRLKGVASYLRDRLRSAVIRQIEAEIARLEHDLQMARLGALGPTDDDVAAAEAALEKARAFLNGSVRAVSSQRPTS